MCQAATSTSLSKSPGGHARRRANPTTRSTPTPSSGGPITASWKSAERKTMLDFDDVQLDAEDRDLRMAVRAVADAKIEPLAAAVDESGTFPHEALSVLAQLGYLGMLVPERFGGAAATELQYLLVVEEVARACAATAATFMTQAHAALPFLAAGTDAQCEQWLPTIADGSCIGC